jgi:hypothetical protein
MDVPFYTMRYDFLMSPAEEQGSTVCETFLAKALKHVGENKYGVANMVLTKYQ